jgi:Tol biopolymer transport system component
MRRPLLVAGLALVLLASAALALPHVGVQLPPALEAIAQLPERLAAQVFPPRVPAEVRLAGLTGPERDAVGTLTGRLAGLVVWSSNRSGNHELYLLDLGSGTVRRLTSTPSVEFYSRFSPDGRRIVFTRSQRDYVSFRDPTAWDVYVINTDGTGERLLARNGSWPQWAPEGNAIVFWRDARVIRLELDGGRESVLLDGATIEGIRGNVETPELSSDGERLAVTVRSRLYGGVAVIDLASHAVTRLSPGSACQVTWMPGSEALLWIESAGNGGTRVMTGGPGRERGVFMDLPGAYSHEYFPRVSNDGRWLAWGAAARGHEHDRADYEIFVWQIGRPSSEIVRLTHHPGNDQWPDVHVPR